MAEFRRSRETVETGTGNSEICNLLSNGDMQLHGVLPWSSNYTFLVTLRGSEGQVQAVYKPRRGETPLWDFPQGSLCLREYAAYLVSEAVAWSLVPPTVLRSGVHGFGSVQLFVDAQDEQHYFTFHDEYPDAMQRVALFDVLINNADRKSGHCLLDCDSRVWAVDHGICFHCDPKLRTVIWEFAGEVIPKPLLDDVKRFQTMICEGSPLSSALGQLLSRREVRALRQRVDELVHTARFPEPDPGRRVVPWPLV